MTFYARCKVFVSGHLAKIYQIYMALDENKNGLLIMDFETATHIQIVHLVLVFLIFFATTSLVVFKVIVTHMY